MSIDGNAHEITHISGLQVTGVIYKKGYTEGPCGQAHYHSCRPEKSATLKTPIALFHQNPKSAFEYRYLIRALGKDRLAIALDTPGYGESDGPDAPLSMEALSAALATSLKGALHDLDAEAPVDVFGFHTGALIASQIAITEPALVRRVVLSGVPFHDEEKGRACIAATELDFELSEDGAFIKERWRLIVENRAAGVSVLEAAKNFLEDIRSLNKIHYAYHAVYKYRPAQELPKITQPVLIAQPHEMLLEETRQAHREAIPQAMLIEMPTVIDDVFDTGWREYADVMRGWLDED